MMVAFSAPTFAAIAIAFAPVSAPHPPRVPTPEHAIEHYVAPHTTANEESAAWPAMAITVPEPSTQRVQPDSLKQTASQRAPLTEDGEEAVSRNELREMMASRLEGVAALADGWWGPSSRAVPRSVVEFVGRALDPIAATGNYVAVAAHADGTVYLEWNRDALDYTVEIGVNKMLLIADDLESDTSEEVERDLDVDTLSRFVATGAA
jgi:hypothetical protein